MSTPKPPDQDDDAAASAPQHRRTLNQRTYYTILDQRIAAAQADGMFDNLPGAGKPFEFADEAQVPEEDRVGYRILKNAGFAPAWIELQKAIREEQATIRVWLGRTNEHWSHTGERERARLRVVYHERLVKLNRQIVHYNLVVPPAAGQLSTLHIPEQLALLGA